MVLTTSKRGNNLNNLFSVMLLGRTQRSLQHGEGGGCWILRKFRMDDWELAGIAWTRVCQRIQCCWWAAAGLCAGSRQWGGSTRATEVGFYSSRITQVRGSWQRDERSAWCLHKHRAELPGGSVIRIMLSAVTHLELLTGLVEGREGCDVKKGSITVCSLG